MNAMSVVPFSHAVSAPRPRELSVTLLGATGSIGSSTADLLRLHRERFRVEAVTAQRNAASLAKLARELGAKFAVVADPGCYGELKDALARLRKFGGRCVIGFQSIAQVSSTYGAGDAQTIVENCGNTLILRCSGSDNGGTSHFASRLIGEREIVRRQTSRGRDREGSFLFKGSRRSINVSEQHVIEAAVMPSELEQLPDLSGFLKTASSRAWRRVRIARQPPPVYFC